MPSSVHPKAAVLALDTNLGWMDRIVARQRRPARYMLPLQPDSPLDRLLRHLTPRTNPARH